LSHLLKSWIPRVSGRFRGADDGPKISVFALSKSASAASLKAPWVNSQAALPAISPAIETRKFMVGSTMKSKFLLKELNVVGNVIARYRYLYLFGDAKPQGSDVSE